MSEHTLNVEQIFISDKKNIILDARSPSEFLLGHIPGSISFPLFSDEERKKVGITYKKQGPDAAILEGLKYVDILGLLAKLKQLAIYAPILVYCARGGMRSQSIASLLKHYGYPVKVLTGGYKAFRNWTLAQFEKEYTIRILGGKTGVGKTEVLKELSNKNQPVIDLEGLASHKGSVFGGEHHNQPTQQQFENELAKELLIQRQNLWIEDESLLIGRIKIPHNLFMQMSKAKCFVLEMSLERRIQQLIKDYASLGKDSLKERAIFIKKRLGGLRLQQILSSIEDGDYSAACEILLTYYDKKYGYALSNRENHIVLDMQNKSFDHVADELIDLIQTKEGAIARFS